MSDTAAKSLPWFENRPGARKFPYLDFAEVWAYREVAFALAVRDLKLRYKQTAFGVAWALIQPIGAAVIFTLVFDRLAGLPSDGITYPVFVFSGLAVWFYFSGALESAALSLVESRELVTKVYFPRLLAPLAAVLPGLVDLLLSLVIVGVFMATYGVAPAWAIALLPLWILAVVAVAFAAGTWLAALNVLYRDIRYTLTFLVQIWLFASPVVFPSSLVDGAWRYLFYANPMAAVLDGFRWSLLDGPAPPPEALVSVAVTVALLVSGVAYLQRVEHRLADRI